jgi:hypothetical protein
MRFFTGLFTPRASITGSDFAGEDAAVGSAWSAHWGAGKIIDFTRQDFTKDEEGYDFIFDAVGSTNFFKLLQRTA